MTQARHIDAAQMEAVLKNGRDRCCYCQRKGATLKVAPVIPGQPTLIAHPECDEPVQAWRRGRM